MLTLKFTGTFQCFLSTDTDPPDEARGVSGYAQVLPGEPGMDRVIRFQPAGFARSHCPPVGVRVSKVFVDGHDNAGHALVGASVDLLGDPKFEGRNGLLAEDGDEPIVPFDVEIAAKGFRLRRAYADRYELWRPGDEHPFEELRATGVNMSPGEIAEETGVWDMHAVWAARARLLQADLAATTDDDERARLERRLSALANGSLLRFYGARMLYFVALGGTPTIEDATSLLPRPPRDDQPWRIELWFAGWDPDAFQGFVKGYLHVPLAPSGARSVAADATRSRPELASLTPSG